ncbi:uncharacterized protein TNCT_621841 [Trichonephila clavata]|uniref:Peptidase aspartic putative domain-containing protein n=1 Tax=Trichonephila clavata TaxID=2740835 RepID=A0A8X6JBH4_TRICU|nr:uncharacterized protein TNCT_621841 [Trichonephila clavata]
MARFLFDSGSQESFIRNDLKNALNLKPSRQETLLIYTFSNRKPLKKTFEVFKSINIEALVTDEITGAEIYLDLTPKLLRNLIPSGCQLADSFQKSPIKSLHGLNFLVNTIAGEPAKINKNLLMLPTLFGETLIGQLPILSGKVKHSSVNISCSVLENTLRGMDTFLLGDETRDSLREFGKERKYAS